ncbi:MULTISPECIES: hypothetical protein [unclassified Paenibacillus]|uniref:hypothetical protein n=1 Tax=unclassified Paenibacillus TaxID=185978 RepID=UPI001AE97DBE|nr:MULTISPECIES: hypothetical protein [unclassified Paenibacillus]MBP1153695.1 dipeptidyl aminopeptidase/acylaminoacyl peptidase [Paenibacillus sp. PvP091]MBP1170920.1 dipeptidyl aminopeptidase/acylaminoacyl peptidase [Paenibacillus sp. PvR098]MBP2441948.1 dipeptidyl aminopeptidase/acylaminoacyl peptidase [Paenibacillus sp. PvP052]
MAGRDYSLLDYFIECGKKNDPLLAYRGGDISEWQALLRAKVYELLGSFPQAVGLEAETIWEIEEAGLIKEKIVFNSESMASIPAVVVKRADLDPDRRYRTILCLHGHGPFGKDSVVGVRSTQEHRDIILLYNYDYAVQFAQRGYIAICPV